MVVFCVCLYELEGGGGLVRGCPDVELIRLFFSTLNLSFRECFTNRLSLWK